jgi:hypothetical protein
MLNPTNAAEDRRNDRRFMHMNVASSRMALGLVGREIDIVAPENLIKSTSAHGSTLATLYPCFGHYS